MNVRIPAGERDGPSPLRRSRSAPINTPMPSATASFRIMGSKMCMPSSFPDRHPKGHKDSLNQVAH